MRFSPSIWARPQLRFASCLTLSSATAPVFLFDEFDSLGLSRGAQHDVAEMRRVLNSLLVFVENMRGHSLLIAASNHPEALDSALYRRFDDVLRYSARPRRRSSGCCWHDSPARIWMVWLGRQF